MNLATLDALTPHLAPLGNKCSRMSTVVRFGLFDIGSQSKFCNLTIFCNTCSLCRIELEAQFLAMSFMMSLFRCGHRGVSFIVSPFLTFNILTFISGINGIWCDDTFRQAGDADLSQGPDPTSGIQESHLYPLWYSYVYVTVLVHYFCCNLRLGEIISF